MQQVHDIHHEVHSIFEAEIAKLSGLQKVSSTGGKMDSEFDGQDRMALRAAWKLQGILSSSPPRTGTSSPSSVQLRKLSKGLKASPEVASRVQHFNGSSACTGCGYDHTESKVDLHVALPNPCTSRRYPGDSKTRATDDRPGVRGDEGGRYWLIGGPMRRVVTV